MKSFQPVTTFASAVNPFVLCDDPIPPSKLTARGKYEDAFTTLKFGDTIKCKPTQVLRIASALRAHITSKKIDGMVRSMTDYGDGMGRVWFLKKEI